MKGLLYPWALLLALCVHVGLAFDLGLSPDEAHYALYAAHLDWSYYDHPPLVGWLQWLPWRLGGADGLMRVVPTLSWLAGGLALKVLLEQLWPGESAIKIAALWLWLLSPMVHLLGLAWVPDTPLMPLTCLVMALTWRLGLFMSGKRPLHSEG